MSFERRPTCGFPCCLLRNGRPFLTLCGRGKRLKRLISSVIMEEHCRRGNRVGVPRGL